MEKERCDHCGANLKKYWHTVTPGLVKVLIKCYAKVSSQKKNIFKMKELSLDHSEYGNFQKLRFHALIAKSKENREWLITRRGADFLKGMIQIPFRVQTFRNRVVDHDTELVTLIDVMKSELYWEQDFSYEIHGSEQLSI